MATNDVPSRQRLVPPGPNRTAASKMIGRRNTTGVAGPPRIVGPAVTRPKTQPATSTSAAARSAASARRARGAPRSQAGPAVAHITMAGTSSSWVKTLEKNRVRQTDAYDSSCTTVTIAASRNEERNGATRPAATMKTAIRRRVSNRAGAPLSHRTPPAAIRASLQFVTKRASTRELGHDTCNSAARCTGNAASRQIHHRRGGTSSSAAVRMAFGGHTNDGVDGGNLRTNPMLAPA